MNSPDERLLDEQIRASTSDAVPPAVEGRLRAQLADFRSRLSDREAADPTRDRIGASAVWWRLGLTGVAAVLLMAAAGLLLRPRTSFAEVANAVLDRPWVHMRTTVAGQGEGEFWYSPAWNVSAAKRPDAITYEDYRLRISETYDPEEGVVTRIPIVWGPRDHGFDSIAAVLTALLQGGGPAERSTALLELLGPERGKMTVLDQRVERVTEDGHEWIEFHLNVAGPTSEQPLQLLFRADVDTKLPVLCRISGHEGGKPVTRETRFDYPEAGPADLYALGVPRTARVLDRVPAGDVKRILETIRAGRERMDNYRAIFVMHIDGLDYHWWTDLPVVFYRKGTKFRADYPFGQIAATERPDPGEDLGKWWRERTKSFRYFTKYVVRDATTFTSDVKWSTDPDGTPIPEIVSVLRTESGNHPGEIYPPTWSMQPEFACRPPLGLGHPDIEPVLDLHPIDGPAGCVLLRIRHTSTENRVNEEGVGVPDKYRYWLDPKRDYIVMRWDMVMQDAEGREEIIESATTEEIARSPQGVWYATKIRRRFPDRDAKGEASDQVYHLYVDFDVELPDALFEPPAPGRVR